MSYPNDGWRLCPDDGPRRIVRQQPTEFFPTADLVAVLDLEHNILHVNRALYASLSTEHQARVLRTRNHSEYVASQNFTHIFDV